MKEQRVREAYRKLKGCVYYDKTLAYIRTRLVEYENDDLEKKLDLFARLIEDEKKW